MVFNPNRFELGKVAEFPFVSDNTEALSVALWRTYEKFFAAANEYEGVKVLSFMSVGVGHLWTANRPVVKLEDVKGLKIRMSGVYVNEVAQAIGVAPVAAPGPKAYELVSSGVVDGTMFGMIDILNFKLEGQMKYMLRIPGGLNSSGFAFILNKAKWDSLSKADQSALMSVSGEAYARLNGKAWDRANERALPVLQKAGIKETQLSPEVVAELKRRLAPIETGWLAAAQKKGVDGKAALEYFRAQVAAIERGQ
jgi:TRAP-type C4-dicarboxylate transport system substrate-binding protein